MENISKHTKVMTRQDVLNEDNYESMCERDERLAERLLDYLIEEWIVEEHGDNIIIL